MNQSPSSYAAAADAYPTAESATAAPADALQIRRLIGAGFALIMAFAFVAAAPQLLNDPDTLWHITVGADIWQTKSFPHTDAYSHSFAGEPWIAKEWLSQIILYAAYATGGWNGVVLLTISVLLIVLAQTYWALSLHLKPIIAGAVAIGAISLSADVLVARPHIIVLPLILLFVARLWIAAEEKRAPAFWLLGVMCLWSNMHASFTFGFVAAFLAFLLYLHETRDFMSRRTMLWIGFLALCPVAAIIHPYGVHTIWSTVSVGTSEALPYVQEWRAFSAAEDFKVEAVLLAGLAALMASRFRTNIVAALFICLLLHMYFTHTRFIYLLFLIAPVLLARDLAQTFEGVSFQRWASALSSSERGVPRIVQMGAPAIALALAACAALLQTTARWSPPPTSYPIAAIEAARAHGVTGNVMNEYGFGGALIFERIPTFIDGRADRLFQDGFMPAIEKSMQSDGVDMLKTQIADYEIGWALMRPEDGRRRHFERFAGWSKIYEDNHAVVFAEDSN